MLWLSVFLALLYLYSFPRKLQHNGSCFRMLLVRSVRISLGLRPYLDFFPFLLDRIRSSISMRLFPCISPPIPLTPLCTYLKRDISPTPPSSWGVRDFLRGYALRAFYRLGYIYSFDKSFPFSSGVWVAKTSMAVIKNLGKGRPFALRGARISHFSLRADL